jgi:hypothetical protein
MAIIDTIFTLRDSLRNPASFTNHGRGDSPPEGLRRIVGPLKSKLHQMTEFMRQIAMILAVDHSERKENISEADYAHSIAPVTIKSQTIRSAY